MLNSHPMKAEALSAILSEVPAIRRIDNNSRKVPINLEMNGYDESS